MQKKTTMPKFILETPLKLTMDILCYACYRIEILKEEETNQTQFTHAATP